jgi:ribose transport system ATP-binding protein
MHPDDVVTPRPAAAVRGVSKAFGHTQALDDVHLDLAWGEIHALVGGNGSGKSTLLKILAGVQPADSGVLETQTETWDLRHHTPEESARSGFRFVHQDPAIFPILSIADNLGLGGQFVRGPLGTIRRRRSKERAREVLRGFDLDIDPGMLAAALSAPQRALLAIGRALQDVGDSQRAILFLDEPTAALPAEEAADLLRTLRRLAHSGHSVVLVSHRLDEVRAAADRVTCLRDGRNAGTIDAADLTEARLAELILGSKLEQTVNVSASSVSTETVLELRNISGGPIRDVSFALHRGEIVGLAGLLGSGRTELMELIYGVRKLHGGELLVRGRPVHSPSSSAMAKAGVAFVPEDRGAGGVFPDHSVAMNLTVGQSRRYFRHAWLQTRQLAREVVSDLSKYAVKAGSVQADIQSLSGGNQQKVVLGRWLRTAPAILLLDEPTQGIDVGARETILTLIADACRAGTAVLIASSEFEELSRISHRTLVLSRGRIVEEHPRGTSSHDLLESVLDNERAGAR